jgi:hypothetical protein
MASDVDGFSHGCKEKLKQPNCEREYVTIIEQTI